MRERSIPNDSGASVSTWMQHSVPAFDTVQVPPHADVCIIGAGMAGLSVAHALVGQGARVLVIDDGPVAGGETGRTSGHLCSAIDDRFWRLEKRFGADGAARAAQSHAAAIDAIEADVHRLEIDCDFERVDGHLFVPPGGDLDELDRELHAARRAGLSADKLARAPLPFDTGPCLRFAHQAQFQPIAYLSALARAIVTRGGTIRTGLHVTQIDSGAAVGVHHADGRLVHADFLVDATNAAITSTVLLPSRQAAYRTYMIALDGPRGQLPHALFWDTADPYHYVRMVPRERDRETVLVGGEDHRTGHDDDPRRHWVALEQWARERFPDAGELLGRWSGQIMEPFDGLAFIGRSPDLERVFVVTGDSGNGLTHGAIASLMLPKLIQGRDHEWADLYDPGRSRFRGLGTAMRETASSTAPYLDWLRVGDSQELDDVAPGEGAIIRDGMHLVAAFRDESGKCHLLNAKCPHLRGVVRWNAAEQTWDCPCHGSRFDARGRVLNGPAMHDLEAFRPNRVGARVELPRPDRP